MSEIPFTVRKVTNTQPLVCEDCGANYVVFDDHGSIHCPNCAPLAFRFEDFRWAAPLNEWDEPVGKGRADVHLVTYNIVKRTPKGFRLYDPIEGRTRLVCHHWRKKFASETIEQAKEDFLARKAAQMRILLNKVKHVEEAVAVFNKKFT